MFSKINTLKIVTLSLCFCLTVPSISAPLSSPTSKIVNKKKNVIYILTDDQRYDEVGFLNPRIDTPNMDKLAAGGVYFKNAFVTTALCSPSRATILTGQYMHNHGVVDNNNPAKESSIYFPSYLQEVGYETSFFGKWHMGGHGDSPQPGFDHWLSFAGQGHYYPVKDKKGRVNKININGKRVDQKGYITDELTDYAVDWLEQRDSDKPFFMYLSHKAVHSNFDPAPRHKDQYSDVKIEVPASQADTEENYAGKPMWVKNQRNSWHGVDFPYHSEMNVQEYKRQYHRALSAVDDSLGRVLKWLKDNNLENDTVVMLMGDNGFMFGEHGLIDKRNAYEESMRVPLLAYAPGYFKPGTVVNEMVANLDIAPTILAIAGAKKPEQFEGESWLSLAKNKPVESWRKNFLYEYYWEFNYPSTPTTFALRTDNYKLIQYHGVWDTEELYDLKNDPKEMHNLIDVPEHQALIAQMRHDLFKRLLNQNGDSAIPYTEKYTAGAVYRERDRGETADFPDHWLKKDGDKGLRAFLRLKPIKDKKDDKKKIAKH